MGLDLDFLLHFRPLVDNFMSAKFVDRPGVGGGRGGISCAATFLVSKPISWLVIPNPVLIFRFTANPVSMSILSVSEPISWVAIANPVLIPGSNANPVSMILNSNYTSHPRFSAF